MTEYLKPKNYDEFIKKLKTLSSDKDKLNYLFEYFKNEVTYDYDVLTVSQLSDNKKIFPKEIMAQIAFSIDQETCDNNMLYICPNEEQRKQNVERLKKFIPQI